MMQREHQSELVDQQDEHGGADDEIAKVRALSVIVGAHRMSPCDYEAYARFKLWVAKTQTDGTIDTYCAGNVSSRMKSSPR